MTELPLFSDAEQLIADVHPPALGTVTDTTGYADSVRRSALWAAYGDALGWISELVDEAGVKRRTNGAPLRRPIEWKRRIGGRAGIVAELPQGCYSDDSQLRLATGRAIGPDGFDVESFAKVELPVWLSYQLGAGRSSSAAATNLVRRRVQWFSNTFNGWTDSGGNGAAMRIQPHVWAARDAGDPTTFLPDVVRNSICTHSHPRGLLGASLHALALAHALTTGKYPTPDDLTAATGVVAELPDIIGKDVEVGNYWRSTFERECGALGEIWTRTINECQQAIQAAADPAGVGSGDKYASIVDRLGLRDPARRGDGTLTAIAAVGLTWCETQPEQALSIAANAIGTDTDTIATMAGAILGTVADQEPPVEVLDVDLFRSEADRLADIASGRTPPNHRYPDLLHWSAPEGRADTLVSVDGGGLHVRGLGHAKAESEPILSPQGKFSWQWVKLEIGQTLLIKRRDKLQEAVENDRGLSPTQSFGQTQPKGGTSKRTAVDRPSRAQAHSGDIVPFQTTLTDRPTASQLDADLKAMIDHLEKHNYEDKVVGQALRRVVNRCTPGQIAAFLAVLINRLGESSGHQ